MKTTILAHLKAEHVATFRKLSECYHPIFKYFTTLTLKTLIFLLVYSQA